MGLTIAVGFVVDDAIVMLENIFRHIEEGMLPLDAAIKGASEIGFTIISISFSLIAVFIPLLLMGGIVGRLFREFAIAVSMTIVVSALVSLTLTPMMASRFLAREAHQRGASTIRRAGLHRDVAILRADPGHRVALPLRHADGVHRHGGTDHRAVRRDPEGLFPDQDTGNPDRHHRCRAGHLVHRDVRFAAEGQPDCAGDPAVASVVAAVGAASPGRPPTTAACISR